MGLIKITKLHEDGQSLFFKDIKVPVGGTFDIKDADGFTIFQITADGTVKTRRGIERI